MDMVDIYSLIIFIPTNPMIDLNRRWIRNANLYHFPFSKQGKKEEVITNF